MGQPGKEFPQPPEVKKTEPLKIKSSVLKNIIKQTIFSVATDDSRPVLTGEFLEITPKKINVVAIDGFRVSFRTELVEEYTTYTDIIVPARTLGEISSVASAKEDEIVNMYFTDRHALFEMSNCTMVSRLIDGQYMDYESLFNTDNNIIVKVYREELLRALERSILIVKDPKKAPVTLEINDNVMSITAKTEMNEVFEQISIENDGDRLNISFNANYLVDVLKNIEDEMVEMQFMSTLSPCIIKGIDKENYKYLVLPLKM
jgi:DNA polymerase-3 subunit beta